MKENKKTVEPEVIEEGAAEKKEKKPFVWTKKKIVALCVSAVSLILVAVLLIGMVEYGLFKVFWKDNDAKYRDSYLTESFFSDLKHDEVIATMGDYTLTNGQLQVFFWMQLYEILDYYGNYAEYYLGIDLSKPLKDQEYNKTGKNWEQYILEEALASWHRYQATAAMAAKANFVMPEDYQKDFAGMRAKMETTAKEQGYPTVGELMESQFGKGATYEDYYHYLWVRYTAELYFSDVIENLKFTDAELDDYFQKNKEELGEYGVEQDDSLMVDFRNILVKPVTSKDESGKTVITEEAWADAEKKAQDILDNWKGGEADETTFASLAKIKSEDKNTASNGGLNQYVVKNAWATVDVRHILIKPKGGTKDDKGNITYSDAEWETCRAEAQKLLDQYLAGEQTAEKFGELANAHSEDQNGKVTNGGLYTDVVQGKMIKEFDAWIFDDARTPGETGLVKTVYGYHVMYFVERKGPVDEWLFAEGRKGGDYELIKTEEGYQIIFYVSNDIEWKVWCEQGLMNETSLTLMDDYTKENAIEVNYWAILMGYHELKMS